MRIIGKVTKCMTLSDRIESQRKNTRDRSPNGRRPIGCPRKRWSEGIN